MQHRDDNTVIDVEGFSFRIGKQEILRDVSFAVRRGEYVSIVGPNGAGKTTILKCLDRILVGGSGRIEICGQALASYSRKQLARLIGYVPQADGRVFPYTVEQFVLMARYPYLSPFSSVSREDRQAVGRALALTDTSRFAQRRLDTLSGGERQEVFLAAAIAQGTEILLLDEPTTFLDYRHQDKIQTLLARVRGEAEVTIVAVTHDVNRAALDSDRIVGLRAGSVVFRGSPSELMKPDVLGGIFEASFLMVAHPGASLPVIVPRVPSEEA